MYEKVITTASALALLWGLGFSTAAQAAPGTTEKTGANACWSKLSKFDANNDGVLAGDELRRNGDTVFGVLDRNGNKVVARQEYGRCITLKRGEKSAILASFDVFDADHDGRLTSAEFKAGTEGKAGDQSTQILIMREIPVFTFTVRPQDWSKGRSLETSKIHVDDLIGRDVVNLRGNGVAEVGDVVMNRDGKALFAVLDVGGFLGMGEKQVAVPFDQLRRTDENVLLLSEKTEAELKSMPAYRDGDYRPYTS